MDKTIDWVYTDLIEITAEDIQRQYKCEIEDAQEAMDYVNRFIKDVNKEFESVK
jgi:beta-xylosidase